MLADGDSVEQMQEQLRNWADPPVDDRTKIATLTKSALKLSNVTMSERFLNRVTINLYALDESIVYFKENKIATLMTTGFTGQITERDLAQIYFWVNGHCSICRSILELMNRKQTLYGIFGITDIKNTISKYLQILNTAALHIYDTQNYLDKTADLLNNNKKITAVTYLCGNLIKLALTN